MPAERTTYPAAAAPPAPYHRPRTARRDMSAAERAADDAEREMRRFRQAAKTRWAAALAPWTPDPAFRWPVSTVRAYHNPYGIYKNDAKTAFGLSEAEILTLAYEAVPAPAAQQQRRIFALTHVRALASRKAFALAAPEPFRAAGDVRAGKAVRLYRKDGAHERGWTDLGVCDAHALQHREKEARRAAVQGVWGLGLG
ncbi:hypothetical protein DFH11DRAFT_1800033 [Phellopilus nigrolimitatus]|nr:hypothetical protein DFH11DRAFT_1800033 [Phellopilus nigrolimitatus]